MQKRNIITLVLFLCIHFLLVSIVAIDPSKDYYAILGISKNFTDRELKKAYRKLALKYHPDKTDEADREKASETFVKVSEAYEILSDPEKRRQYDEARENGGSHPFPGAQQGSQGSNFAFKTGNANPFTMFEQFFGKVGKQNKQDPNGNVFQEFQFSGMGGDGFSQQRQQKKAPTSLYPKESVVTTLTRKKFPGKNAKHQWLVHFYSLKEKKSVNNKWKQDMESIHEDLGGKVKVGALNCERFAKLCAEKGISTKSLPAFAYISHGELILYKGELDRDAIFQFAIQQYKNSLLNQKKSGKLEKITSSNEWRLCNIGPGEVVTTTRSCVIFILSNNKSRRKKELAIAEKVYKQFSSENKLQFSYAIRDQRKEWMRQLALSNTDKPFLLILRVKRGKVRYHAHEIPDFDEKMLRTVIERCIGGDLTFQDAQVPIHF